MLFTGSILLIDLQHTYAAGLSCVDIFSIQQEALSPRERLIQKLSMEEFSMIQNYTHTSFGEINRTLRKTKSIEDILKVCGQGCLDLMSALKKMPNYRGKVYRGTELTQEQLNHYTQVGSIVTENSFLSTSKDPNISRTFEKNAWFIIKSKTGKDMENISVNPYEKEVIFLPYTKFRVVEVINHYGEIRIRLEEV